MITRDVMLRGSTDDPCWHVAPNTSRNTSPIDGCNRPLSVWSCGPWGDAWICRRKLNQKRHPPTVPTVLSTRQTWRSSGKRPSRTPTPSSTTRRNHRTATGTHCRYTTIWAHGIWTSNRSATASKCIVWCRPDRRSWTGRLHRYPLRFAQAHQSFRPTGQWCYFCSPTTTLCCSARSRSQTKPDSWSAHSWTWWWCRCVCLWKKQDQYSTNVHWCECNSITYT